MSLCFSKRIIQGGLTRGAYCPNLVVHGGGCFIPPVERLRAICHNSKAAAGPSLWPSKESVMILYLVQASHQRGFPGGSEGKESSCNAGDLGLIPGWEDALENRMSTHSSILTWEIPWTEEPGGLQSMGSQRVKPN